MAQALHRIPRRIETEDGQMDSGAINAELERIAQTLSEYLLAHPQAADTLEGIRHWWLPKDRFPGVPAEVLQLALDRLVERGALARVAAAGGVVLYVNRLASRLH